MIYLSIGIAIFARSLPYMEKTFNLFFFFWCVGGGGTVQDEKIELCRFSKDGTKPFLFCTVQRGIFSLLFDVQHFTELLLDYNLI